MKRESVKFYKKNVEKKEETKEEKQVIKGLHMVSGTRYPAWSDHLKKRSEGREAASKGQCPVGHSG